MRTENSDRGPDESLQQFAFDLRSLRQEAGDPTLATLSSHTGIPRSILSEAFSGKRLPTERTVRYLVEELGASRHEWAARRNALAYGLAIRSRSEEFDPAADMMPEAERAAAAGHVTRKGSPAWVIATVSAVTTAMITSGMWMGYLALRTEDPSGTPASTVASEVPLLDVADGVDPVRTICKEDAVIAASEARLDGDVQVQLLYSNQCSAAWGRVTRYDGKSFGNTLEMTVYPAVDMDSARKQTRRVYDVQSLYTTLMIEPDVEARVCAIATVSVDGDPIELAPPICI